MSADPFAHVEQTPSKITWMVFVSERIVSTHGDPELARRNADHLNAAHESAVRSEVEKAVAKENNTYVCIHCGSDKIKSFSTWTDCGNEYDAVCDDCGSDDVFPRCDAIQELIGRIEDKDEEKEKAVSKAVAEMKEKAAKIADDFRNEIINPSFLDPAQKTTDDQRWGFIVAGKRIADAIRSLPLSGGGEKKETPLYLDILNDKPY